MNYLLNIVEAICWSDFICVASLLAVPTTFCLLLWLKSPLVKSLGRLLATMAVLSLIGWVIVVAGTFCSQMPENGFASFCTLAFGWTYAWIVGLPVILLSFLLRVLHSLPQCFRKKMAGYESSREKQIVHVAILLFVSLVIAIYLHLISLSFSLFSNIVFMISNHPNTTRPLLFSYSI